MSFGSAFLGPCTDPPLTPPRRGIKRAPTKACSPPGSTGIELSELQQERSADFSPLPAVLAGPERGGLKSALLNSMAVPPRRGRGWVGTWNGRDVPLAARLGRTNWVWGLFLTAL